jgi:hypothetical protein
MMKKGLRSDSKLRFQFISDRRKLFRAMSVGDDLTFSLELIYALPGKQIKIDCQGEAVRIEQRGEKFGIAAKINSFQSIH